jgi:hypothetical protein
MSKGADNGDVSSLAVIDVPDTRAMISTSAPGTTGEEAGMFIGCP